MFIIDCYKVNVRNFLIVLFSFLLYPLYNIVFLDLSSLAELEKLPKELSQTMCSCINKNNFVLNFDHPWTNLINIISVRRSIYGSCSDKLVVVKKRSSLDDLRVIELGSMESNENMDSIRSKVKNILNSNDFSTTLDKFTLCPSLDNIDLFFSNQYHKNDNLFFSSNYTLNLTDYIQIFYNIQLSMEPIIQQITRPWAVAEYLGRCGVFTVSEYCGDSLTSLAPSLEWTARASIAVQLLEFAFNATFGNPHFSFYFTDMTPDNFAVSTTGVVKLVDLDNVIVVDKSSKDPPVNWETLHENFHDHSENGFMFSTEKICSHKISDLNIYSICQGIFSDKSDYIEGGLLRSPPEGILNIKTLVEECISPPTGKTRFDIARTIMANLT